MFKLELPKNYKDQLLGYELFTVVVENISTLLKMQFDHPTDLAIVYDIIAKSYLNTLKGKDYDIDLYPLFYMQSDFGRTIIPHINNESISINSAISSFKLIELNHVKEVSQLTHHLAELEIFILRYKKERFSDDDTVLISFIESMLIKGKPNWLKAIEKINLNIIINEPLITNVVGPNIGESITIVRPFRIKNNHHWELEKVDVFTDITDSINGGFYFDVFSIRVMHKYILKGNKGVVTGESIDKKHRFIADVTFDVTGKKAILEWHLFHTTGGLPPKEESVPFYEVTDFSLVNERKGNILNEYQLKCLVDDAKMQVASLS